MNKYHVGEIIRTQYGTEFVVLAANKTDALIKALDPKIGCLVITTDDEDFKKVTSYAMESASVSGNLKFYYWKFLGTKIHPYKVMEILNAE